MNKRTCDTDPTGTAGTVLSYNEITKKWANAQEHFWDGVKLGFTPFFFGLMFWFLSYL